MHVLQPKHTKVSQEEAKALLLSYKITSVQLPKIKSTDPALPLEAKSGDIIKIERKNTNTKTIYFRVVI